MDIQSLLNSTVVINAETKSPQQHQREPSWSSCSSSSSPNSPYSSSSYSIPSSPELDSMPTTRSNQTRTPWSQEEDLLLQQGYSQGLSWAMISTVFLPHRSRGCCWGRFKTLQSKQLEAKQWTDAEDRLLMLAVKKHNKLFKQAWKTVAQDMNGRSWKECEGRAAKSNLTTVNVIKKKHY